MDAPWKKLNDAQREIVLYGSGDEKIPVKYQNRLGDQRIYQTTFEGVINNLRRRYLETTSDYIRSKIEGYMAQVSCSPPGQALPPRWPSPWGRAPRDHVMPVLHTLSG
jgi:excinuclease ABC subunit A